MVWLAAAAAPQSETEQEVALFLSSTVFTHRLHPFCLGSQVFSKPLHRFLLIYSSDSTLQQPHSHSPVLTQRDYSDHPLRRRIVSMSNQLWRRLYTVRVGQSENPVTVCSNSCPSRGWGGKKALQLIFKLKKINLLLP